MDDLISKLSEIRSKYNCLDEAEEPYYRALSEAIKKLSEPKASNPLQDLPTSPLLARKMPSAQPEQQWIPCSERLPDKKDDYLCSYNGCAVADICEYDPDRNEWGFFYDGGWKVVSNVIAWMPLPEPYKAERLEE